MSPKPASSDPGVGASTPEDGAAQVLLLCSVRYCNSHFKNRDDELPVVATSAKTEGFRVTGPDFQLPMLS